MALLFTAHTASRSAHLLEPRPRERGALLGELLGAGRADQLRGLSVASKKVEKKLATNALFDPHLVARKRAVLA